MIVYGKPFFIDKHALIFCHICLVFFKEQFFATIAIIKIVQSNLGTVTRKNGLVYSTLFEQ